MTHHQLSARTEYSVSEASYKRGAYMQTGIWTEFVPKIINLYRSIIGADPHSCMHPTCISLLLETLSIELNDPRRPGPITLEVQVQSP
jgi:hypothetical protein